MDHDLTKEIELKSRILLDLSSDDILFRGTIDEAFERIVFTAALALRVERVGIWLLDHVKKSLECKKLYHATENRYESGVKLTIDKIPAYFDSFKKHLLLQSDDALNDKRLVELRDDYLIPNNIKSMLDASIRQPGEIIGVICFEHVDELRTWEIDETIFAVNVASLISEVMLVKSNMEIISTLNSNRERLRSLLETTSDVIWEVDLDGRYTYISPRVVDVLGYDPDEMTGRPFFEFISEDDLERTSEIFSESIKNKSGLKAYKLVVYGKDGRPVSIETSCVPILDEAEEITGFRGIDRDITEGEHVEKRLKDTSNLLKAAIDSIPDVIRIYNDKIDIVELNVTADSPRGKKIDALLKNGLPRGLDDTLSIADVFITGKPADYEIAIEEQDTWLHYRAYPITNEAGKVSRVVEYIRDISARKKIEEILIESEIRYRNVFEYTGTAMGIYGDDAVITLCNSEFEKLSGCSRVEIEGKMKWHDFVPPDELLRMKRYHEQRTTGDGSPPKEYNFRFRKITSEERHVHINIEVIPETRQRIFSMYDITEMIETQEKNKQREKLSNLVSSISSSFINMETTDIDKTINESLKRIAETLGIERVYMYQFYNENSKIRLSHKWIDTGVDEINELFEDFETSMFKDWMANIVNGRSVRIHDVGELSDAFSLIKEIMINSGVRSILIVPIMFQSDLIGILGMDSIRENKKWTEDIVETVRMIGEIIATAIERFNQDQMLKLQSEMIEQSLEGIAYAELDGTLVFVNHAWAEMHGRANEDFTGKNLEIFHTPEQMKNDVIPANEEVKKNGIFKGVVNHIKADGTPFPTNMHVILLKDDEGRPIGFSASARDITEERKLEEQLRQIQRVESIGQVAGGIAHDFNNMMSPILAYTELLLLDMDKDDPRMERLLQIQNATKRAQNLTRQLLTFSRKHVTEMKVINLSSVILSFEKILRRTVRENVELSIDVPESSNIRADISQIEQILMNIVLNAQDAMPFGGRLEIMVSLEELDKETVLQYPGMSEGEYVLLTIKDSGAGMDEETLERIFEPFFTTKEVGRGTGLGLSTVYGIVRQHSGHIMVESEINKGTTVSIIFPATVEKETESTEEIILGKLPGGSETIMVVEDNDSVRNMVKDVLRQYGYNIFDAENANKCIEIMKKHKEEVALLLTDVVMPDVNGRELYSTLLKEKPGLKVIYMSGYTDNVIAHHGVLDNGVEFIQKPISVSILLNKIREILDK